MGRRRKRRTRSTPRQQVPRRARRCRARLHPRRGAERSVIPQGGGLLAERVRCYRRRPFQVPQKSPMDRSGILPRHDGATIAYQRLAGRGPGVVFLGGFRSEMTGTKALFLDEYCRRHGQAYVRFDYFGHGASSGDIAIGTIGRWSEDAIAVLDALTEGPQILIGSSMGGWIMLLVALARIARNPRARRDRCRTRLHRGSRLAAARCSAAQGALGNRLSHLALAVRSGWLHPFPPTARRRPPPSRNARRRSRLACPVRLLHGMLDEAVPWQTSLRLAERLQSRDVAVTLVKEGDHRLSRGADLARLAATLDELLGS